MLHISLFQGHVDGSALGSINSGNWDVVVLQGQSQEATFGPGYVWNMVVPPVKTLVEAVRAKDECTVPMFYLTWGKRDGDTQNCQHYSKLCTFEGVQVTNV